MSHIGKNYGIVTEQGNNTVAIFDIDNLVELHHITLPNNITAPLDVVITPDGSTAVVLSTYSNYILQLNLKSDPPVFTAYKQAKSHLTELDISPDGRFAVAVDGSLQNADIHSYSLQDNSYKSEIPAYAQFVAVCPKGNGLVLTGKYDSTELVMKSVLIPFFMNTSTGELTASQKVIASYGDSPENLTFTFDGNYALVVNTGMRVPSAKNVAIFNTKDPNNITWLGNVNVSDTPQSIVVSRDGKKVYVLTSTTVDIFDFNPNVSPYLTPANPVSYFLHGLDITHYYGVDQIALDKTETKLFISGKGTLKGFNPESGAELGSVQGVNSDGGIAILRTYQPPQPTRGFDFF